MAPSSIPVLQSSAIHESTPEMLTFFMLRRSLNHDEKKPFSDLAKNMSLRVQAAVANKDFLPCLSEAKKSHTVVAGYFLWAPPQPPTNDPFHEVLTWSSSDLLAEGTYGQVFAVSATNSGQRFALKLAKENGKFELMKEHDLIRQVHAKGACHNVVMAHGFYSDGSRHGLLLELMPQSLSAFLKEQGGSPNPQLRTQLCFQRRPQRCVCKACLQSALCLSAVSPALLRLLQALMHLASRDIVHADLKPGNILFNACPCRAVVSDFGLAERAGASVKPNEVYTRHYRCWELFEYHRKGHGPVPLRLCMDMWAYGCVAFEIWSGGHVLFPYPELPWATIRQLEEYVSKQVSSHVVGERQQCHVRTTVCVNTARLSAVKLSQKLKAARF